jgi:hypothetical protein
MNDLNPHFGDFQFQNDQTNVLDGHFPKPRFFLGDRDHLMGHVELYNTGRPESLEWRRQGHHPFQRTSEPRAWVSFYSESPSPLSVFHECAWPPPPTRRSRPVARFSVSRRRGQQPCDLVWPRSSRSQLWRRGSGSDLVRCL